MHWDWATALHLRSRSTGEAHQALVTHPGGDVTRLRIPEADNREQAEFETEVGLRIAGIGGLSEHPYGIVRLTPEPDCLTIRLSDEPYVVRWWADQLLPAEDPSAEDVLDRMTGICGLRYRVTGQHVHLFRPGETGVIRLTGFNTRWWLRIAEKVAARSTPTVPTFLLGDTWSRSERAAHDAQRSLRWGDPYVGSAFLRRIRATTGPGQANGTDMWCTRIGRERFWTLETTDGPPCSDLVPLFTSSSAGLGWTVETHCCGCSTERNGCSTQLVSTNANEFVRLLNLRWGRLTITAGHRDRVTELNRMAFRVENTQEDHEVAVPSGAGAREPDLGSGGPQPTR